jgi:hypothetical protein
VLDEALDYRAMARPHDGDSPPSPA